MTHTDPIPAPAAELTLEDHAQRAMHVLGQIIGGVAMDGSLAKAGALAAEDVVRRLLAHQQEIERGNVSHAVYTLNGLAFSGDYPLGDEAIGAIQNVMEDLQSGAAAGLLDLEGRFVPRHLGTTHRNDAIDLLWPGLSAQDRQAKANLLEKVYPGLVQAAPSDPLSATLEQRWNDDQDEQARRFRPTEQMTAGKRREAAVRDAFWRFTSSEDLDSFEDCVTDALFDSETEHQELNWTQLKAVFDRLDPSALNLIISWGFSDTVAREAVWENIERDRQGFRAAVDEWAEEPEETVSLKSRVST